MKSVEEISVCSVFSVLETYLGSVLETGCYFKAELDEQVPEVVFKMRRSIQPTGGTGDPGLLWLIPSEHLIKGLKGYTVNPPSSSR